MVNGLLGSFYFVLHYSGENNLYPIFALNPSLLLYGAGSTEEVGLEVFQCAFLFVVFTAVEFPKNVTTNGRFTRLVVGTYLPLFCAS